MPVTITAQLTTRIFFNCLIVFSRSALPFAETPDPNCSRAAFARKLRANERTLEKWEQGRAKPNPQAAALVLVRKHPDTLDRLEAVAAGV